MANASRDENNVPTLLATSNIDGSVVVVTADPVVHGIYADDGNTGTSLGNGDAARDENFVPVFMGVSSVDGVTPVAVYADPATGHILINSN